MCLEATGAEEGQSGESAEEEDEDIKTEEADEQEMPGVMRPEAQLKGTFTSHPPVPPGPRCAVP